jgi:TonB family protein
MSMRQSTLVALFLVLFEAIVPSIGSAQADDVLQLSPLVFPIPAPRPLIGTLFNDKKTSSMDIQNGPSSIPLYLGISSIESDGTTLTAEDRGRWPQGVLSAEDRLRWAQGIFFLEPGFTSNAPSVWPLDQNKIISFDETGNGEIWRHHVKILGSDTVRVREVIFQTAVINDHIESATQALSSNYDNIYWYSPYIGWPIKMEIYRRSGSQLTKLSWQAGDVLFRRAASEQPLPSRPFVSCNSSSAVSDRSPIATRKEPPKYPGRALSRQIEGVAGFLFTISADGSVSDVRAVAEVPEGYGFADAGRQALERFQFEPPVADGHPVTVNCASYWFSFKLH